MDGDVDDLEFLLASVRNEISVLRGDRRLRTLAGGTRGVAMRQHVLDLIGAAEYWLKSKPDPEAPSYRRDSFSRILRDLMLNLQEAHAALPWLEATREPQINLGSLYLAEETGWILLGKNLDLVVVPNPEYMYATQSWPFRQVVEGAQGFVPKTKQRPVVLHYPLGDSNRLLLHSIFGHELGHSAVQEMGLVEDVLRDMKEDQQYRQELDLLVTEIWPRNSPDKTIRTVESMLRSWIEELLCDHLAAEIVGPSYLWAFAGFVLPLSYGNPLPNYPPVTVRMKLLLDQLAELGWAGFLQNVSPRLADWLGRVGEDAADPFGQPYAFLRNQVVRQAGLLQRAAAKTVGRGSLPAEPATTEAAEADALLEQLVLPVGSDPPLSPRAILLGGWQRAIAKHGDRPPGLISALADWQLQNLVGKAIEMSVVVSSWEDE